jgi:hypothetical protein
VEVRLALVEACSMVVKVWPSRVEVSLADV